MSNTFAKPSLLKAATILPLTLVPIGKPNSSPNVTLIDGAVCTITCLDSSSNASKTSSHWSRSLSAPVGQFTIH